MPNALGFSLYLSTFAAQWPTLRGMVGTGATVFLSLHISEEFDDAYCRRAKEVCHTLADGGFRIIADVSVKTLAQFGCADLTELAEVLRLWALRIDYGFSVEEIARMAEKMPIVLNASTTTAQDAARIAAQGREVYAMHNFYPRPETGLDEELMQQTTDELRAAGVRVMAFIAGDTFLRGPVFEGLPTMEAHRKCLPCAAFIELSLRFGVQEIFLADPGLSEKEQRRIAYFCKTGVIPIPACLQDDHADLYDRVFTCRADSPKWMVRFQESREYSCKGAAVAPDNCVRRDRGAVTVDNVNYGRYTGEIQMLRAPLPADPRVNVIGSVAENALRMLDLIPRGGAFVLVRP